MVSNDGADGEECLGAKRLCSACVGESFLQAEIDAHGEDAICSYCGSAGKTFSIEEMADRVETAFEHHFRRTADEPSGFEYAMMKEDGRGFEREGDRVADVIGGAAEIDEEPAEDIRSVLEDRNWDREMAQMGEEGPFDSDTHYTEATPDDAELHSEWLRFERSIKTEARFFSRSAEATLASVFEGLKAHKTRDGRAVITEAGPGKKLSGLFRARAFQSDAKLEAALMRPDREVGPPPTVTVLEAKPGTLGDALASLSANGMQVTFIDVPPHSDAALAGAVAAADAVVMPSLPSAFDIHSLASFLPLVASSGKPAGVVLNAIVPNTVAVPEGEAVLETLGLRLLAKVTRRMIHQYAAAKGLSPCELEPKGLAAKEIEAIMAAVVEMLEGAR